MNLYEKYFKRLLDIVFSLTALLILSPILLITSILIRVKLGTPIIFKQKRPGKDEYLFEINKFRTMTEKRDDNGELLPPSKRVTSFGKKLRSTSLDELPELWNILKGEMSFVGPRPLKTEYLPYYTEEEKIRHSVRPGLTGLAQIKGRNNISWEMRLGYDIQYVNELSLLLDLQILIHTIFKVLKKENVTVYGEGKILSLDIERGENKVKD
ncbi:Sugar transferase involved in LPS biosynthesis (colanic, teichoic acid) [Atopostipes suicloacalis DSM 15692]|uniref:Sugar transferase involved in LPS biosynthesis (Colanic, teichoic acid) n=1 Tax=Atopostipes suicloacalis DSM 15692 TaxID=1121025 RepID=A0A1M4X1K6_9LACT|nr:sugar transferase [Atopostipes suicloacalis]SHE87267.1 Sugar transferase involved in LPS biosynthesis (colanic, teichoic acid) [Atopostipes suicloacalis DSM 15692]